MEFKFYPKGDPSKTVERIEMRSKDRRNRSNLQQQNQRKALMEQDKVNRQTPFDPQKQFFPADLFILVGFDSKGQPVYERNPRWHTEDGFYIGSSKS